MDDCYVLDSTVVIDLHGHLRPSVIENGLEDLACQSRLKIPEGVLREPRRISDKAGKATNQVVETHADYLVQVSRVPALGVDLARVEKLCGERIRLGGREYPGFWHNARGRKAVDGQVVAAAKKLGRTLASDDRAVRLACMLENVPCIGWTEFARRAGMHAQRLLPFS